MSKQEQYEAWADDYHHSQRQTERSMNRQVASNRARRAFKHENLVRAGKCPLSRASAPTHRAPVVHYTRT